MQKNIDFLEDITTKYSNIEMNLDQMLRKIEVEEVKWEKQFPITNQYNDGNNNITIPDLETARHRNKELIKDLEMSKARLRSRATFSPLEHVLKKAICNYVTNLSLVPTSNETNRKLYGPIFV